MADEQTTPELAGVSQEEDIQARLVSFYTKTPRTSRESSASTDARPEADAEGQPSEQPDAGEPTPDDLPDEEFAEGTDSQPVDEFEIVHNGQQHRMSRDEVIRLAQQGFDYTQKRQADAEHSRQLQERLARVAQIEQVAPQLQSARAQVEAIGNQLAQYQRVDWVALATNDPLEYSKIRAQHDVLMQTYQQAVGQYQNIDQAVRQHTTAVVSEMLAEEAKDVVNRIPAWRDPERQKREDAEVTQFLLDKGATINDVKAVNKSWMVEVAYMAAQYDKLVKSKSERSKLLNTKPPMTRPGAATTNQSAGSQDYNKARASLKKSGDWRDAAKILARMK